MDHRKVLPEHAEQVQNFDKGPQSAVHTGTGQHVHKGTGQHAQITQVQQQQSAQASKIAKLEEGTPIPTTSVGPPPGSQILQLL